AEKDPGNTNTLCDCIIAEQNEINIKESTKEWKIKHLISLLKFVENKNLNEITKQDILDFLNNKRKPEAIDPTHKSIGTWNNLHILFLKFFRWLNNPNEPDPKKRETPDCMKGVRRLPRKEKSSYKPSDLWTVDEHSIFLKYCPSKRDRAFHAMANDTSARPHELLNLKIKDIKFKITADGIQYAEILVSGKTKPRTLPLFSSIPYIKDWLLNHPTAENPESWIFISQSNNQSNNTIGRKLTRDALLKHYKEQYRNGYFTKLLKDETVPVNDKSYIKNMLTKPWNLYVLRHSALTQKSKILKEHILRDHAGWSASNKMPQTYIHYFGTESSNSLLEAYGIIKPEDNDHTKKLLKPKSCPNCNESNKHEAKICNSCKMILSYESYKETVENENEMRDALAQLSDQVLILNFKFLSHLIIIKFFLMHLSSEEIVCDSLN
ncbi:MAG: tyrosine-type recombinase/integrase, partial [Nitrososphaeraceae archaeon]